MERQMDEIGTTPGFAEGLDQDPDPGDSEAGVNGTPRAQLQGGVFDGLPIGIAVFDTELRLLRCNAAWTEFDGRTMVDSAGVVVPDTRLLERMPDQAELLAPLLDGVLAGKVMRRAALRVATGTAVRFWDVVLTPTHRDGEVVGFTAIATETTERGAGPGAAAATDRGIHRDRGRDDPRAPVGTDAAPRGPQCQVGVRCGGGCGGRLGGRGPAGAVGLR